jgi:putative nucleotidyltransferase with HDIG domain/PAS domain S-box-containing protein
MTRRASVPRSRTAGVREQLPALQSAAEMEAIVHAGSWAVVHPGMQCRWSPGLYALLELEPGTVEPSLHAWAEYVHADDREAVLEALGASVRTHEPFEISHRIRTPSGLTKIVLQRARTTYGADGAPAYTVATLVDITSQQRIRKKLDDATAKLMAVWEHVPEGLLLVDTVTGTIVDANPFAEAILARAPSDIVGMHFASLFPQEQHQRVAAVFAPGVRSPVHNLAAEISGEDEGRIAVEISTSGSFRVDDQTLTLASLRDVTQRKNFERSAARVGETMAAMVRANAAIVRAESPDDLLRGVCEAMVGGPFCDAWIGEPQLGDPRQLAVPIRDEERSASLVIVVTDPAGFGADETALFASLGGDIVLALRALRSRELHVRAEEREHARAAEVEAALEGALTAVATTLEKRDPYTAGHERNVAELAKLIARELALDDERARGLYLAALVHDIGKIAIPAEILTKPTRLTAIEYAFVKQHPDVGYEIMAPIPFPWRIAEIVRQHHEYLDGSGYPRGLRGDEILLESRILTVADIVESMSAFRPYHRPIGLAGALEEVDRLAGTKLDRDVVDACARVVGRGAFQPATAFPDPHLEHAD